MTRKARNASETLLRQIGYNLLQDSNPKTNNLYLN